MSEPPNNSGESKKQTPAWKRVLPLATTALIFFLIFRRIPFGRFLEALRNADYTYFLLLMVPNSLFYFGWDTLVLTIVMRWFHGPIRYSALLPVRAVAYILSLLNSDLAGGATAYYLTRQSGAPFLQIVSTVVFLSWLELTHLAVWATAGMLAFPARVPAGVFWIPAGVTLFWTFFLLYARRGFAPWRPLLALGVQWFPALRGRGCVRDWSIFRTFRIAALGRYLEVILLRAPMFFVSLLIHYLAVRAFGFHIPFWRLLAFLPIVFMLSALPITVAHLGTTQAAWIFFFRDYAAPSQLLAFSLAVHLAFMLSRGLLGLIFLPRAYEDLVGTIRFKEILQGRQPATSLPSPET